MMAWESRPSSSWTVPAIIYNKERKVKRPCEMHVVCWQPCVFRYMFFSLCGGGGGWRLMATDEQLECLSRISSIRGCSGRLTGKPLRQEVIFLLSMDSLHICSLRKDVGRTISTPHSIIVHHFWIFPLLEMLLKVMNDIWMVSFIIILLLAEKGNIGLYYINQWCISVENSSSKSETYVRKRIKKQQRHISLMPSRWLKLSDPLTL